MSFETAESQGYRTEDDEDTHVFNASMIQLGWQHDELISDKWVKIEDQPAVRVMTLIKQEEDPDSERDRRVQKTGCSDKKETMVYCMTGLPMSKQQELVEASFQLRARLLEMNAFTFSAIDLQFLWTRGFLTILLDLRWRRRLLKRHEWCLDQNRKSGSCYISGIGIFRQFGSI